MNKTDGVADYDRKVLYLKSYRDKFDRIIFLNNQMIGVKAINYRPSSGGHKSIEQYLAEKEKLMGELRSIEDSINAIPDLRARSVVGYKYLQFKTYQEIAELMNYSYSQIRNLHRLGVNQINLQKDWQ